MATLRRLQFWRCSARATLARVSPAVEPLLEMTPVELADFGAAARSAVSSQVWDYIEGGSGAELTIAGNRAAFDSVRVAPRMLVDVSSCSVATELLGAAVMSPIGVAPTAYQRLVHPTGELGMAAGAAGHLFVVSFFATHSIEDIAATASGPLWLQLYWLKQRSAVAAVARRAEASGYQAVVLTVDAPRLGRRFRDMRNSFAVAADMRAINLEQTLTDPAHESARGASALAAHADLTFDTSITWADLAWLRGVTRLPLVLKGILTAHDAKLAIEHGVDGIIVSNHGGRQVDGAVATLHALPGIVEAVDGRAMVLLDGGVRSGRDAFIALALGADGVLLGRPPLWALAAGGADGVRDGLRLIDDELAHLMALAGRPTLADVTADALAHVTRGTHLLGKR